MKMSVFDKDANSEQEEIPYFGKSHAAIPRGKE